MEFLDYPSTLSRNRQLTEEDRKQLDKCYKRMAEHIRDINAKLLLPRTKPAPKLTLQVSKSRQRHSRDLVTYDFKPFI